MARSRGQLSGVQYGSRKARSLCKGGRVRMGRRLRSMELARGEGGRERKSHCCEVLHVVGVGAGVGGCVRWKGGGCGVDNLHLNCFCFFGRKSIRCPPCAKPPSTSVFCNTSFAKSVFAISFCQVRARVPVRHIYLRLLC